MRCTSGRTLYSGYLCSDAVSQVIHFYEKFGRLTTAVVLILVTAYVRVAAVEHLDGRVAWGAECRMLRPASSHATLMPVRRWCLMCAVTGTLTPAPCAFRAHGASIPMPCEVTSKSSRKDRQIYLYCTCQRQATSVRVARELLKLGLRVAVIEDGLRGWRSAGLTLETVPPEELAITAAVHLGRGDCAGANCAAA